MKRYEDNLAWMGLGAALLWFLIDLRLIPAPVRVVAYDPAHCPDVRFMAPSRN